MLGGCWRAVGGVFGGVVGGDVGGMWGGCWRAVGGMLGGCWGDVGGMLGGCWGDVGGMLGGPGIQTPRPHPDPQKFSCPPFCHLRFWGKLKIFTTRLGVSIRTGRPSCGQPPAAVSQPPPGLPQHRGLRGLAGSGTQPPPQVNRRRGLTMPRYPPGRRRAVLPRGTLVPNHQHPISFPLHPILNSVHRGKPFP